MKKLTKDYIFKTEENGALLDLVKKKLSDMPNGKIKSLLEHRCISVDMVVTSKYSFPVRKGQTIKITTTSQTSESPLPILYEDDVLIAVDKPAGLLSVANDTEKERTAYRILRENGIYPIYVVHRLDRDTSGVLLFAKNQDVRDALQLTWDKIKRREYIAICEGVFEEKKGRIETYLKENIVHKVYSTEDKDGKKAITNYEVLRENKDYSYLRVLIDTGRKNQIRVHLSELSHPVVGDKKYGATSNPLSRLGLHANILEFTHPTTGKNLIIRSKPSRHFTLPNEK